MCHSKPYVIHVLTVILLFVFSAIQNTNTKNIQNRYIRLLYQTTMNLGTAGAVVIYFGLSKINCMNTPYVLLDIFFAAVVKVVG